MKSNGIRFNAAVSRWIAGTLSVLLLAMVQPGAYAQAPAPQQNPPAQDYPPPQQEQYPPQQQYPPAQQYPPPQQQYPPAQQYPPQQQYPPAQQYPPQQYPPQQMPPQGGYVPLDAMQLNQLVAPIALYPDSLVAQILTAATYPQQVSEANNWIHQYGGMPPAQLADAVNNMPWDPSVKALAEFPSVLDNMARNYNWTGALGNAYYSQPGDVMNAVQAMRFQAQQAGTLRPTPQQRVYDDGGLIVIAPVNPAFVYVPYYNPWAVYGVAVVPWGGYYVMPPPRGVMIAAGVGIGFGVGISLGLFAHYGWGYHAWAPNWRGGVVVYNHTTYISRSVTVVNRGNFGGFNRGVYERAGRGVPNGFRPAVTPATAQFHAAPGFRGSAYSNDRPAAAFGRPGPQGAPAARPQGAYNGGRQPAPEGRGAPQGHAEPNSREGHQGGHAQPRGEHPKRNEEHK